ncbi:12831_t:CDS:1, partial [Ambispora leptoticha]
RQNSKDHKHTDNKPDEKKLEEGSNVTLQNAKSNDAPAVKVTATS